MPVGYSIVLNACIRLDLMEFCPLAGENACFSKPTRLESPQLGPFVQTFPTSFGRSFGSQPGYRIYSPQGNLARSLLALQRCHPAFPVMDDLLLMLLVAGDCCRASPQAGTRSNLNKKERGFLFWSQYSDILSEMKRPSLSL